MQITALGGALQYHWEFFVNGEYGPQLLHKDVGQLQGHSWPTFGE